MKTAFGMRRRPHFEIIGWKTPGDDGEAVLAKPVTPQLSGPAVAPTRHRRLPLQRRLRQHRRSRLAWHSRTRPKPKPPVQLTAETLTTMGDVKPVTSNEIFDDDDSLVKTMST